jgi:hypothetical protein
VSYFKFTPRAGSNAEPFTISMDHIGQTKNLVCAYKINEIEEDYKFILGEKQEFKMQTSIKVQPKPDSNLENIEQSADEFYPDDDMEVRVLQLGDEESSDNESSSKCVEPSDGDKGRIKAELIQYLHTEVNRMSKLKDIRIYLQQNGYKIA